MQVWPYAPDWSSGVDVEMRYRTRILRASAGREQRIAERHEPRLALSYAARLAPGTFARAQWRLAALQREEIAMPVWPTGFRLTADLPSGSTAVPGLAAEPWAVPGAHAALVDGDDARVCVVTAPGVVEPTGRAWRAGTRVLQARVGRLGPDLRQRIVTDRVATVSVEFEDSPGTSPAPRTAAPGVLFDGAEVFDEPIDWSGGVESALAVERETVDYEFGRPRHFHPIGYPTETRTVSMTRTSREAVARVEGLYHRMRGARGSFYFPSQTDDLPLAETPVPGSRRIVVRGRGLYDALIAAGDPVRRALAMRSPGGQLFLNRITGISGEGNETTVDLRDPLTVASSASRRVSFLTRARLASDVLAVRWVTDRVATIRLAVQTLEDPA